MAGRSPTKHRTIPGGKAMRLWGKAMRLQVIPGGEVIENYWLGTTNFK